MLAWCLFPLVLLYIWIYRKLAFIVLLPIQRYVRYRVHKVLKRLDIRVNTDEPNPGDLVVHNKRFYHRLAVEETIGLGEMYMEGWFDCDRVDVAIAKVARHGVWKYETYWFNKLFNYLQFECFNRQTAKRSWEVARKHYDLGNDLFKSFLDPSMNYSCGYWKDAKNLEEAQLHKMDLIARKLKLSSGMRVLDIGCGWGGLCKYLAEKYNVTVVGITVSVEGAKEAQERCKGLPVKILVTDYRDLSEKFDRIVSVGMFEHVGVNNYKTFFKVADRCLVDDGLFLLHTIGIDNDYLPRTDAFVNKYIFPNGMLPYPDEICKNSFGMFCIEDWHNFGQYYENTLMAWHANFINNWKTISHLFVDNPKFFRMWSMYLQTSAGLFRARKLQLWQVILTKKGLEGGYESVR